ncbi:osteocalcin 2-like [Episyrphus balteatus]|uniref:osteocalcin 2-like n=1 Tax=Episyrphus balteatus TaxID=286459 RepID=UPI0024867E74|nr:osteocalcin 2-like [Episyrphus balteatus]
MIRPSVIVVLGFLLQLAASVEEQCESSSIGKTLIDHEDCHGYYLCHSGHKLQQYCAPGMKYMHEIQTCVVGKCPPCSCDNPTEPTPSEPSSTTTESSPSPDPTESSSTETSSVSTESSTSTTADSSTSESSTAESSSTTGSTESSTDSSTTESSSLSTEQSTSTTEDSSTSESSTAESSSSSESSTSRTETSTSTTEDSSSSESSTTSEGPTPTPHPVSCKNVPDGSFFADLVHCRDYYVCRNGQPVLLHCQLGTWFDEINNVCNFRHLVNCPANID